jgi:hypothetical protein
VPEWLDKARDSLAEAVGESGSDYELSQADIELLLDLARVAAHDSDDRTNAPLISYLVGLARGRHSDRTLEELIAATRSST